MPEKQQWVALLRAINVGGQKQIKMADLRELLTGLGLENVQTLIASGNVVFEAEISDEVAVQQQVEQALLEGFGYQVHVMMRSMARIQYLATLDPFEGAKSDDTNTYITFLYDAPTSVPELPARFPDLRYTIHGIDEREVFSSATMGSDGKRGEFGKFLDKNFGKVTTTRNWNTLERLAKMKS